MKAADTKTAATPAKSNTPFFGKKAGDNLFSKKQGDYFFNKVGSGNAFIQTKLTIGQPNDKYEKEADSMADKVVQRLSTNNTEIKHPNGNAIQPKPIAPLRTITSFVQTKCAECENEEKLQKKEDEKIVPEEKIQKKPIFESNAEPPDDEKNIQRKCAECEKEEKLQKQSNSGSPQTTSPAIESNLNASKGSGILLAKSTRQQMESSFGADFSNVRIHNDSSAAQMSKELNAQAFTHGSDIYFNSGKYDTHSKNGQHLLAHELTHTVQQDASNKDPKKISKASKKNIQRNIFGDAWDAAGDLASDVGDLAGDVGSSIASGAEYVGGKVWGGVKAVGGAIYDAGAAAIKFLVDELAPGLLDFLGDAVGFIKDKIIAGIDYLTGGLFSKIQSEGLAGILMELLGAGFSSIGSLISEGCSAIASVCRKLYNFAKKLLGPALAAFKKVMQAIGGFFSMLWDDIGKPAWEAIKKYGGAALDWIIDKAKWVWDLIKPIRDAVARAWNWIKEQFGIAWSEAGSVLGWIKEKASAAWDWVKAKIQPIIGPLKIIGSILLLLSPAGPIIAIWYGAPVVWNAVKWLAENFNKYVILKAKDYFYKQILPAINSGLTKIQSLVGSAMGWVYDKFTSLGSSIKSLLTSLSNFVLFRVIGSGIRRIASGIQGGINYVANKAVAFGKWVSTTAARVWNFLEPLREFLRNLLVIAVLGPFSIMDDGVWAMLESVVRFSMKVPCIRELEGLLQIPFWMEKISNVRQTLKDMWFMITHPDVLEAKAKAFLEPYIKQIPGKAESVLTAALAKVGLATTKHISGILKYLLPAVTKLLSNWWPEVKKMIWYLIWPFAEGSPLYTEGPKLWKLVPQIWTNFWHGDFKLAFDGFLEWEQALSNVLGIFAGWIAIGGALIGAIVGAFAGGVGAIPGAGVGFEIGLDIGEGIMAMMIENQVFIMGSAIMDLLTLTDDGKAKAAASATNNNNDKNAAKAPIAGTSEEPRQYESGDVHSAHDRIEYAYQRIGNSALTLGIMGVFILLGAVGGEIAEALMGLVKELGEAIGETLPGVAKFVGEAKRGLAESKLGRTIQDAKAEFNSGRKMGRDMLGKTEPSFAPDDQKVRTTTPEGEPLGTFEGKKVTAEMDLPDGHEAKVMDDGQCAFCTNCEAVRGRFNEELKANPEMDAELKGYEDRLKNNPTDSDAIAGQRRIHNELTERQVERVSPRVKEMEKRIADGDRTITKDEFKQYQREKRLLDDSLGKIRERYEELNPSGNLSDEQIRDYLEKGKRLDEDTGRFGDVDKTISRRQEYMGSTPGKDSVVGRKVMDRMNGEKRMRNYPPFDEFTEFKDADGKWYNASEADMGHHPIDAVDYWNETGKYEGARSEAVRDWMNDPANYELEYYSRNRSEGASSGKTYDPPVEK